MLLVADIGNTNITLGLFDGEALVEEFRLASDKDLSQGEYHVLLGSLFRNFKIDACMIASVVNELTEKFRSAAASVFKVEPVILSHETDMAIKVAMPNPEEVGADRIANASGAHILYQEHKRPVIVVDFGTATSFDIINVQGEFIGGIIAPGLNLQMKVLNTFTSKLPKIDVAISHKAIGHNTADAILSGVIRGCACMIDGLVQQCEAELGQQAVLVATGGYSGLISSYLKRPFDFINPTLTLDGLRYLYNLNVSGIMVA